MISRRTMVDLENNVGMALEFFCRKHGVKTTAEGIRMLIRELPEYKRLLTINESPAGNNDIQNKSEAQPATDQGEI